MRTSIASPRPPSRPKPSNASAGLQTGKSRVTIQIPTESLTAQLQAAVSVSPTTPTIAEAETSRDQNTIGRGRNRVLICVDDDVGEQGFSARPEAAIGLAISTTAESFSPVNQNKNGSSSSSSSNNNNNSSTSASASSTLQRRETDLVLLGAVTKDGRRLTKTEVKFDHLDQVMPQYKLDKKMKVRIITTMKEMDCWSSDEDEGAGKSPTAAAAARKSPLRVKPTSSSRDSGSDSEDSIDTFPVLPSRSAQGNGGGGGRIRDLSKATNPRDKVQLKRPAQIVESAKLRELRELKEAQREETRAMVVGRAVEILVDLRQQRLVSEQTFMRSVVKEVGQGKKSHASRVAFGLVDRALRHAKAASIDKWTRRLAKKLKLLKKQNRAASLIAKAFKRFRFRKLVRSVRNFGRQAQQAEYERDQEELYAFRWRCGHRMVTERRELVLHAAKSPIKPKPKARATSRSGTVRTSASAPTSPRGVAVSIGPEQRDEDENQDEAPTTDERLFAEDFERTRPDLAPFSTRIHRLVQGVARKHLPQVTTDSALLSSIRARPADIPDDSTLTGAPLDLKFNAPRSSSGSDVWAVGSIPGPGLSPGLQWPASSAEMWVDFQQRSLGREPGALRGWSLPTGSHGLSQKVEPGQVSSMWEAMAQVDLGVAETRAMLQSNDKAASVRKSPAYLALEKMCGLTEEDIQRHHERYQSKPLRMNAAFLNSNLLR